MRRVHFFLTDQQIAALRQRARVTGLSMAELVRRAVDAFLKKRKE